MDGFGFVGFAHLDEFGFVALGGSAGGDGGPVFDGKGGFEQVFLKNHDTKFKN